MLDKLLVLEMSKFSKFFKLARMAKKTISFIPPLRKGGGRIKV